jgi:hypothetical protein
MARTIQASNRKSTGTSSRANNKGPRPCHNHTRETRIGNAQPESAGPTAQILGALTVRKAIGRRSRSGATTRVHGSPKCRASNNVDARHRAARISRSQSARLVLSSISRRNGGHRVWPNRGRSRRPLEGPRPDRPRKEADPTPAARTFATLNRNGRRRPSSIVHR